MSFSLCPLRLRLYFFSSSNSAEITQTHASLAICVLLKYQSNLDRTLTLGIANISNPIPIGAIISVNGDGASTPMRLLLVIGREWILSPTVSQYRLYYLKYASIVSAIEIALLAGRVTSKFRGLQTIWVQKYHIELRGKGFLRTWANFIVICFVSSLRTS